MCRRLLGFGFKKYAIHKIAHQMQNLYQHNCVRRDPSWHLAGPARRLLLLRQRTSPSGSSRNTIDHTNANPKPASLRETNERFSETVTSLLRTYTKIVPLEIYGL
ncbi:hypothetical protein EVAR_291_1 [Eumeta japonica]|uniref:Uncharacterized protein n=1 Tax=Eumeta variegata TaxID=151549 RepID=A0A4C1S9K2_EUMVA|nr:hypothetical protein EVAR_291_1 [Eumeta japonica]